MNLNLVSRYRNSIFGISIISIIIFHYCENFMEAVDNGLLSNNLFVFLYYHIIGSVGVEIFLFLSGMGLYYSFSKEEKIVAFYKKRFVRVLTCYLPMGILFWLLMDIVLTKAGVLQFFKDLTLISFWTEGNTRVWFIALILVLYIVFPLLYKIIYKNNSVDGVKFVVMVFALALVTILVSFFSPQTYSNIEIALSRIPIFCFGCYLGGYIKQGKQIGQKAVCIIVVGGFVIRLLAKVLPLPVVCSRYAASFWSISLIMAICFLLKLSKSSTVERILDEIGKYSLELYLSHVMIRSLMNAVGYPTYFLRNYLIVVLASAMVSVLSHYMTLRLSRKFSLR